MNSERKAFEEAIKKISGGDIKNQINEKNGEYLYGVMQLMWVVWQSSAQRQGYKLVPVETLVVAMKWYDAAMEHTFDLKLISESEVHKNSIETMMGAVDD